VPAKAAEKVSASGFSEPRVADLHPYRSTEAIQISARNRARFINLLNRVWYPLKECLGQMNSNSICGSSTWLHEAGGWRGGPKQINKCRVKWPCWPLVSAKSSPTLAGLISTYVMTRQKTLGNRNGSWDT